MLVGGYGFLAMFYLSGATSVPRRYSYYPAEVAQGATYAGIAVAFITVFLLGLLVYLAEVGKRWLQARRGEVADAPVAGKPL